jgi:hypothetical protein
MKHSRDAISDLWGGRDAAISYTNITLPETAPPYQEPPTERDIVPYQPAPPTERDIVPYQPAPPTERDIVPYQPAPPTERDIVPYQPAPQTERDIVPYQPAPQPERDIVPPEPAPPKEAQKKPHTTLSIRRLFHNFSDIVTNSASEVEIFVMVPDPENPDEYAVYNVPTMPDDEDALLHLVFICDNSTSSGHRTVTFEYDSKQDAQKHHSDMERVRQDTDKDLYDFVVGAHAFKHPCFPFYQYVPGAKLTQLYDHVNAAAELSIDSKSKEVLELRNYIGNNDVGNIKDNDEFKTRVQLLPNFYIQKVGEIPVDPVDEYGYDRHYDENDEDGREYGTSTTSRVPDDTYDTDRAASRTSSLSKTSSIPDDTYDTDGQASRTSSLSKTSSIPDDTYDTDRPASRTSSLSKTSRIPSETSRSLDETSRSLDETSRISDETSRISDETSRISDETSRNSEEASRISDEASRISDETSRISDETSRISEEASRNSEEASRISDEASRISDDTYEYADDPEHDFRSMRGGSRRPKRDDYAWNPSPINGGRFARFLTKRHSRKKHIVYGYL